jgi:hypothetical protein
MGRFAAGLLVGLVLGGLGVYLALRPKLAVVTPAAPAAAPDAGRPRHRRAATHPSSPAADEAPIELGAADRQTLAAGDALRASDTIDMAGAEARALTQGEIDAAMAARADDVIRCITQARGAAPVTGSVLAGVVVDGAGRVTRTRVEAPAYLVHHGLYDCARRPLAALRFPATGRETVVTVPFDVSDSP